jgi:hypothetical protein
VIGNEDAIRELFEADLRARSPGPPYLQRHPEHGQYRRHDIQILWTGFLHGYRAALGQRMISRGSPDAWRG